MIGVVQYADPGDEDEERPVHRLLARRAIDALNEHVRLCPICILKGVSRCKIAEAFGKLARHELYRAGIKIAKTIWDEKERIAA